MVERLVEIVENTASWDTKCVANTLSFSSIDKNLIKEAQNTVTFTHILTTDFCKMHENLTLYIDNTNAVIQTHCDETGQHVRYYITYAQCVLSIIKTKTNERRSTSRLDAIATQLM